MALSFLPRHFERAPAQTFWLRDDTVISSVGSIAKRAEDRFRQRIAERMDKTWPPASAGAKRPSSRVTFKQGRPGKYLKKIKVAKGNPVVPIGDVTHAGAESFRVEIEHERITVQASTDAGFNNAFQALFGQFNSLSGFFAGGVIEDEPAFPFRAFLLSLAHQYKAPKKGETRVKIPPYDQISLDVMMKRMSDARFNAVIVDVENAVQYKSHPEISRSHSQPMEAFRNLVRTARSYGLSVIPKTNFSKSPKHRHNDWFEPYHRLEDGPEYFRRAGKIMDELIAVAKPEYYHIGMDEDHRSAKDYVACIVSLREHLLKKGVIPIIWIDVNKPYQPEIEEKMWEALKHLPRKDLIITHWQYHGRGFDDVATLRRKGYTVICGTWNKSDAIRAFTLRAHAQGAAGMVGTVWYQLSAENLKMYGKICGMSGSAFWTGG